MQSPTCHVVADQADVRAFVMDLTGQLSNLPDALSDLLAPA
jgi:hypothetical protein